VGLSSGNGADVSEGVGFCACGRMLAPDRRKEAQTFL